MSDYRVEATAYVKLLLHAAKYQTNTCSGLLVGEEQGQGFVITDAVPLFHHDAPLAPLLEVACAMVDAWCQTQGKKIVGYYHASESDGSATLSHFGEKMADKIEANCSRACVLLVENQQLNSEAKSAVQVCTIHCLDHAHVCVLMLVPCVMRSNAMFLLHGGVSLCVCSFC